jgi:hypothetical protein
LGRAERKIAPYFVKNAWLEWNLSAYPLFRLPQRHVLWMHLTIGCFCSNCCKTLCFAKPGGESMLKKSKALIAGMILTGMLGAAMSTTAVAEDRCERRIHEAEAKLQDAIAKHGEHSRQAEKRRHDLEETRRHCEHH